MPATSQHHGIMASSKGKVRRRPYGSLYGNDKLPATVSLLGLGCSSFSTFFWTANEESLQDWTPETLGRNHPRVKEWIEAVLVAVVECGITLLDTAPWYGHGTSEVVIGWALDEVKKHHGLSRNDLTINTKVGRYEADPKKQFDFSYDTTLKSVQRSLRRMNCSYINVLQLHDPEFAPSVDQLLKETIPAMRTCQSRGWCRALGMTGYPLEVQHEILVRSMEKGVTWDQSLVYGHFNLHDTSLVSQPNFNNTSFSEFCAHHSIALLAAAPLSMGLLTHAGPPEWHPSPDELKLACRDAATLCESNGVNISTLAIVVAMSSPLIPCTILGMKNVQEARTAVAAASRFALIDDEMPQEERLCQVLTKKEHEVYKKLQDPRKSPFASVWASEKNKWDGVQQAIDFWKQVKDQTEER